MLPALALVLCAACSLTVDRVRLDAFKKDVRDATRHAEDQALLAERLLCAGRGAADVEDILRANGLAAPEAHKVVAVAEANKRCANAEGIR